VIASGEYDDENSPAWEVEGLDGIDVAAFHTASCVAVVVGRKLCGKTNPHTESSSREAEAVDERNGNCAGAFRRPIRVAPTSCWLPEAKERCVTSLERVNSGGEWHEAGDALDVAIGVSEMQ
jgi:hypothetical protein